MFRSSPFRRRAFVTLSGALLASCALVQAGPAGASSAAIAVPGARLGLRDLGSLPAARLLRIDFVLQGRHEGELARDVSLLATKGSPLYRHFLSNEQWNAYFAPDISTVTRVAAALAAAGFRVEGVSDNRAILSAYAPVPTVERFFGTSLHAVAQPGRGLKFRNVSPALVPAALARDVTAVTGLDDLEFISLRPLAPHPGRNGAVAASAGPLTLFGPAGVSELGPAVLTKGYAYPASGNKGAGVTVGINIPADRFIDSDTTAYLNYFGITQTGKVKVVPLNKGYTGELEGEASLDVETISGLAPGANIDVYESPSFSNQDILNSFNQIVSKNVVDSVSNSFGGGEDLFPTSYLNSADKVFQQAAAKGIAFIFSSGDSGAEGDYRQTGSYNVVADWPASDPNVTSLGGVHITVNSTTGAILSTTGTWPNLPDGNGGYEDGSGGGVSAFFALPSYQAKVAISTVGRNVPDLALPGDLEDANYIAAFGGWFSQGGTSWSGPAFNAMLAEVQVAIGGRTGFVNPTLYQAYGTGPAAFVRDVKTGNNGIFEQFGYNAGTGYDLVTGLGAPLGNKLVTTL